MRALASLGDDAVFRVLQGIGGGGLAPTEQSIFADTFPPEQRAQAFALYGFTVVIAPAVGPVLGGWLTDNFSWHWVLPDQPAGRRWCRSPWCWLLVDELAGC